MKRAIASVLTLVLIISCFTQLTAFAAENTVKKGVTDGGFYYEYDTIKNEFTFDGSGMFLVYCYDNYYGELDFGYAPYNIRNSPEYNEWLQQNKLTTEDITGTKSIKFNNGVTVIDYALLQYCKALTEITIPVSTRRILRSAFPAGSSLKKVYYGGTPEQWKAIVVDADNEALKQAEVTYNTVIPDSKDISTTPLEQPVKKKIDDKNSYCVLDYYTGIINVYGKGRVGLDGDCDTEPYSLDDLFIRYPSNTDGAVYPLISKVVFNEGITALGRDILKCSSAATVYLPKSLKSIETNAMPEDLWYQLNDVYYNGNYVDWTGVKVASRNGNLTNATLHLEKAVVKSDFSFKLAYNSIVYNKKKHGPVVTVTDKNGKVLKKGKDYTVKYDKDVISAGVHNIYVTMLGKYKLNKAVLLKYTIIPPATKMTKVNASSKGFTAFWKSVKTETTGYQVQYSTSKSMKNPVTLNSGKNTNYAKKVTGLKGNKTYYVRVRTAKRSAAGNVYSKWSSITAVKTKR